MTSKDAVIVGDSETKEQAAPVATSTATLLTTAKLDVPTNASILLDTSSERGINGVVDPIGAVKDSSSSSKMHSKSPGYSASFILNLVKAIRSSLEENFAASIDWERVRQKVLAEEENKNDISASDCRILWKKMAYGENYADEDSDEECFFDFPLTALDCKAPDFSGSQSFALTAQLRSEKRLLHEAKKIKFLLPEKIYDGDAHLAAPTFSSSNAHCLSRDLQLPLRSLSWTALQGNPAYSDMKRRKISESESNDPAVLGTMGTVGLFAELAAGRSSAASRWTQGQVRSMPLYKSKMVGSSNTTTGPPQLAVANPIAAQNPVQTTGTVSVDESNAK